MVARCPTVQIATTGVVFIAPVVAFIPCGRYWSASVVALIAIAKCVPQTPSYYPILLCNTISVTAAIVYRSCGRARPLVDA